VSFSFEEPGDADVLTGVPPSVSWRATDRLRTVPWALADHPLVSIVLATLDEREGLPQLIEDIRRLNLESYEVVVVDDGSRDGTRDILASISRDDARVRPVLHDGRRTLAQAQFQGIEASRGSYVIVMDADEQHPAAVIPRLVDQLERGASVAVASRYSPGGSAGHRGAIRAVISRAAEVVARLLLPKVRRIRDPLSGYFGVRRASISLAAPPPRGYKTLIHLLARCNGFPVVEVPYVFRNRNGGESKIVRSLRFVPIFVSEILLASRLGPEVRAAHPMARSGKRAIDDFPTPSREDPGGPRPQYPSGWYR
jgi:glycosyltransferase involved in cell wall biosynthesis